MGVKLEEWLKVSRNRFIAVGVGCAIVGIIIGVAFANLRNAHHYQSIEVAQAQGAKFVASAGRAPFHRPECRYALKIAPGNLEGFATREDAIAAGHVPCKVCRP